MILSIFDFLQILKWNKTILVKLHFQLNQIPTMVILKVTIKVAQGASTFGMHETLEVKVSSPNSSIFPKREP